MVYLVFDMDETLGNFYTVWAILCILKSKESEYPLVNNSKGPPKNIQADINKAYRIFVEHIAAAELSDSPLGILRPGIVGIFQKLAELKDKGIVKGVFIYSNNGHYPTVEFCKDVLHAAIHRTDLICGTAYLHRSERGPELIKESDGYVANKTWNILSKLLKKDCNAPENLEPKEVYFFDDIKHPDLMLHLKENYIQVPGYKYKAQIDRVFTMFKLALEHADLLSNVKMEIFFFFLNTNGIMNTKYVHISNINTLNKSIKHLTQKTSNDPPPPPDSMIQTLEELYNKLSLNKTNEEVYTNTVNMSIYPISNRNIYSGGKKQSISKKRYRNRKTKYMRKNLHKTRK